MKKISRTGTLTNRSIIYVGEDIVDWYFNQQVHYICWRGYCGLVLINRPIIYLDRILRTGTLTNRSIIYVCWKEYCGLVISIIRFHTFHYIEHLANYLILLIISGKWFCKVSLQGQSSQKQGTMQIQACCFFHECLINRKREEE